MTPVRQDAMPTLAEPLEEHLVASPFTAGAEDVLLDYGPLVAVGNLDLNALRRRIDSTGIDARRGPTFAALICEQLFRERGLDGHEIRLCCLPDRERTGASLAKAFEPIWGIFTRSFPEIAWYGLDDEFRARSGSHGFLHTLVIGSRTGYTRDSRFRLEEITRLHKRRVIETIHGIVEEGHAVLVLLLFGETRTDAADALTRFTREVTEAAEHLN